MVFAVPISLCLQFRRTQCLVRLDNITQDVDSILCKDAGLSEPDSFEKCGGRECARWTPGEWTSCQQSRCQSQNTAIQHRTVQCLFSNGTENEKACDFNERPIEQQECYNERCKTIWRTDKWSDVSHSHLFGDFFSPVVQRLINRQMIMITLLKRGNSHKWLR